MPLPGAGAAFRPLGQVSPPPGKCPRGRNAVSTLCIAVQTVYPNNYEYSDIRAFLNDIDGSAYGASNYSSMGFISKAFTASEQALVQDSNLVNSSDDSSITDYICDDTTEKVFLISINEMSDLPGISTWASLPTSYVHAKDSDGYYWVRTPYQEADEVEQKDDCGDGNSDTITEPCGVRPAFRIKIS